MTVSEAGGYQRGGGGFRSNGFRKFDFRSGGVCEWRGHKAGFRSGSGFKSDGVKSDGFQKWWLVDVAIFRISGLR